MVEGGGMSWFEDYYIEMKRLNDELEELKEKVRRLADKWNDESNEMGIQLSADIKQGQKIELWSKCNTLRRCCDELSAAVEKGEG